MGDGLISLYETLLAPYGDVHWWPAKTPHEVIVSAVLTQNTARSNAEKALANFGDNLYFEDDLPQSVGIHNNYHAFIMANAKEHCRERPACEGCPLNGKCGRVGL